MPGGHRNPFNVNNILEQIDGAVHHASVTKPPAEEKSLDISYVDLQIQFIGASGLPKMDVRGLADPYFIAKLDNRISFVSAVKAGTLAPVWNEIWKVKNVPVSADLNVEVLDKDDARLDDYIGKFKIAVSPGAKEAEIEGPFKRPRGTFWLKIDSTPSKDPKAHPFLFDGPIRFSRHFSPTVGLLTNLDDARLYSTWKMYIVGVPLFFGDRVQPWNRNYKAAQTIFQGPTSIAVRSSIQAGHHMLYARSTTNGFGVIDNPSQVFQILHSGASRPHSDSGSQFAHRIKPAVYTYIISVDDNSFRFSETGAASFVDFASKHALHSNCAEAVCYSGEFHPRPAGGWDNFSDNIPDDQVKWEVVIDNNSGTYSPDPLILPDLKRLLEFNFPGIGIYALSYQDPELVKSREACRAYALKNRGVQQHELQPHIAAGEITLSHKVAMQADSVTESTDKPPTT